jgi:hypothetical protein
VTPLQVEWARCREWIVAALPYTGGFYDIEDIERAIANGTMIFLPGKYCALILEICSYPNFKVLNVFLGGGSGGGKTLKEYCDHMDPFIMDFARNADCKKVMHHCRPSGERVGKKLGYNHLWSVMVKDV